MALYDPVDGVYRKVAKKYDPVEGVYRNVKAAYDPVDGVYRQYFSGGGPVPASELAVGDSVWLNVNGVQTEFLVVQQGKPDSTLYDESADGTWLLMKDVYKRNVYSEEGNLYSELDTVVQTAVKKVRLPALMVMYGIAALNYLNQHTFNLSVSEVGQSSPLMADGAKLDYFEEGATSNANQKRVALYNNTSVCEWFLRSSSTDTLKYVVNNGGGITSKSYSAVVGIRPAFILDSNTLISQSDGKYIIE